MGPSISQINEFSKIKKKKREKNKIDMFSINNHNFIPIERTRAQLE